MTEKRARAKEAREKRAADEATGIPLHVEGDAAPVACACFVCGKIFESDRGLNGHVRRMHPDHKHNNEKEEREEERKEEKSEQKSEDKEEGKRKEKAQRAQRRNATKDTPCPFCKKLFTSRGMSLHKKVCSMKDRAQL